MIQTVSIPATGRSSGFLSLWMAELRAAWRGMKHFLPQSDAAHVDLTITPDGFALEGCSAEPKALSHAPVRRSTLLDVQEQLLALRHSHRKARVKLCLTPEVCLVRQFAVPKAAAKELPGILALELERSTPFSASDVFQGWAVDDISLSTRLRVNHVIVKRIIVEPWLNFFFTHKISFAPQVKLLTERPMAVDLFQEAIRSHPHTRKLSRWRSFALSTALVAAISCLLAAHWRHTVTLQHLSREIAVVKEEAVPIRAKLSKFETAAARISALQHRRKNTPSVMAIWEQLTRLFPDSSWVTELKIEKGEIALSGFAQSSAELLSILENSAHFEKAAFSSAIMKAPGESVERFSIRASLSPHLNQQASTPTRLP